MSDDAAVFTIGEVSDRTGLPVRTIRYWSDVGLVPPAGRSASGRRLYDAGCLARLELAATLRELGLGLNEAQRVMANKAALAEVAAMHVEALDVRIRTLRLRRAVLAMVARRAADNEEMTLMNKLARLSAAERTALIDDFVAEVFDGVPAQPGLAAHMRMAPGPERHPGRPAGQRARTAPGPARDLH
jgi:DNA-binding transcriptional MerR regulator